MSVEGNVIRDRIDNGPMSFAQIIIVAIGFILNCIDGIDVVAISVAAPVLSQSWDISPDQLGYILGAVLFGMAIGATVLAPLGDVFGRRNIVLFSVFLTGISMIATGFIDRSVVLMIAARTISGIGIGAIFASTATFGNEFTPERYKNFAVTIIISGYPFGAMIVGPIAAAIIPAYGWEMLFIFGGITTLVICGGAYFLLPESVQFLEKCKLDQNDKLSAINKVLKRINRAPVDDLPIIKHAAPASVKSLITDETMVTTLKLWTIFFMGFMSIYFIISWTPSLFVNSGWTMAEGIKALTLSNFGAVVGTISIGLLTTKYKLKWPIAAFFGATAMFMIYFALLKPTDLTMLYALILLIGIFLNGAFCAMYAVAARIYKSQVRSTGIGWCAGLGRIGAILAPILAGYLVTFSFDMYTLFAVFAFPVTIATLLITTIRV